MPRIKAIAMDVDGVLTDGCFWWGPNGEEFKRFSFLDIMGVSIGSKAGLVFALISGEASPLIDRFATKMGITAIWKNCKTKDIALREFAAQQGLELAEICFIGDDVNDLPALALAGLSAAPSTAHPSVLAKVDFVSAFPGGNGAVREVVDRIVTEISSVTELAKI